MTKPLPVLSSLKPKQVEDALKKCFGNIASAARVLGVDRASVWRAIKRWPELELVLDSMRETMLDNAETALNKAILAGESWAVCFFLKTQGKKRGYSSSSASAIHPILAEIRQAEADLLATLGQLLLTPRSRSSSRLTGDDMQQVIDVQDPEQARILKLMS
jgi:hypothetical protein